MPNTKLQKQLSRKVGDKKYPKWVVAIPPKQIEALGWSEGQSLESEITTDKQLIIKIVNETEVEKRKEAAKKAWDKRKMGKS